MKGKGEEKESSGKHDGKRAEEETEIESETEKDQVINLSILTHLHPKKCITYFD